MTTIASSIVDQFCLIDNVEDPVSTAMLLVRRRLRRPKVRWDREYACFEFWDGSVLGLNVRLHVRTDDLGCPWPWLLAVGSRDAWEGVMRSGVSPSLAAHPDQLCFGIADEERVAA